MCEPVAQLPISFLGPLGAVLNSSRELSEISLWLYHDDSTIDIVMVVIVISG